MDSQNGLHYPSLIVEGDWVKFVHPLWVGHLEPDQDLVNSVLQLQPHPCPHPTRPK